MANGFDHESTGGLTVIPPVAWCRNRQIIYSFQVSEREEGEELPAFMERTEHLPALYW
jgi:hypothetical protein